MQDHRDDDTRDAPAQSGVVRHERLLPATPEEAWSLVSDADGLATWLADEVDLVVAPGEQGTVRDAGGAARTVVVEEVDPGRRLSLQWWREDGEPAVVDLVLEGHEAGTRFVVTEIPLRVVAVPNVVPAHWVTAGGDGAGGGSAPQLSALACR